VFLKIRNYPKKEIHLKYLLNRLKTININFKLNKMKKTGLIVLLTFIILPIFAQQKDKSKFTAYKPGFYQNTILKDVRHVAEQQKTKEVHKRFEMDQSGMELPNKVNMYKYAWHNAPISQGNAGTCWDFSTISMYESEIYRQTGKKVKLSEAYIFYWEYVTKARAYVQTRGKSLFDEGSEGNAVTRILGEKGIVPLSAYTGLINGHKYHTHAQMYKEMITYLKSVKTRNAWNEKEVISTIKDIMNHYIGTPPTQVTIEGKNMTPKEYLKNYLKLNPDDYVEILSYKQEPYWKKVEYKVPDNWWHSKDYYNVPLDVFMKIIKEAIIKGYTMSIGGDVSEAGFSRETQCAMIPDFDIPEKFIDENARQFRFSNKTTTDDHGMHLVGYTKYNKQDWFLIKDSSSGSRNNDPNAAEFGYYFFRADYVKLKMMGFTIHKDAVKNILKKFHN